MAEGTISFVEGLGLKALDSNEVRRQQKSARSSPIISTQKPSDLSRPKESLPNTSLPKVPQKTTPSRKLQQVFEEELLRESEGHQQISGNPSLEQTMDMNMCSLLLCIEVLRDDDMLHVLLLVVPLFVEPKAGSQCNQLGDIPPWNSSTKLLPLQTIMLSQTTKQEWVQVKHGKQKLVQDLSIKGEMDPILSIPGVSGAQPSVSEDTSILLEQVHSGSKEELLVIRAEVTSSVKETEIGQVATPLKDVQQTICKVPAVNARVGEVVSISSSSKAKQPNPKPPDPLGVKPKEKAALSKSAQKKLRKQVKEQALLSCSSGGK
ncbi:hypothetical protein RHSIM_RhsimUnG0061300 [Rhododendron simsii]|uniref:Uncharacterized protein n=1 Tax=Rhododendron simsii TaxID=118357 RepID=A0A834FYN0_RHOSS|nr:hypothetical protein RHSIM_RhsimUnG0061300 [Rhododendron simsii]